jgi:PAS domain S-box-containing protein
VEYVGSSRLMTENEKSSRTMRIDLIPDAPSEPVGGQKKRVIVSSSARKGVHPPIQTPSQSPGLYGELLNSVYDAALITDLAGRVVDCNPRACEFFLLSHDALVQRAMPDLVSGADETLMGSLWRNLQNERFTLIQAYCVRGDGSYFPAEIAVNRLNLGESRLCFFVRDTTIRRQAEEMLRTEHNAIQNAGDGIAVADLRAVLEYVNPAVGRLWGRSKPEDLIGTDVRTLFRDEAQAEAMVREILDEQKTWSREMKAVSPSGEDFDVQVTAARNRNSDGEVVGMVFSFTDMSDRKRAEEALREAERHRVMLESLGAACHHLGQPATVLLGNLELLRARLGTEDKDACELLDSSIRSMDEIGSILHRLNQVNEYRTTCYLGESQESGGSRILEI